MARKFLAWFNSFLILLGILMPAAVALANYRPGSWAVSSSGPVYSGGNTIWTYTVTATGSPHDLSHLDLAACQNFGAISSTPAYSERGQDGSLEGLPYVLKWASSQLSGSGSTITVEYAGLWAQGAQTWYVKAGQDVYSGAIGGPSCTTVRPPGRAASP